MDKVKDTITPQEQAECGYDKLEDDEKEIFDHMDEYEHFEMDDNGKMVKVNADQAFD